MRAAKLLFVTLVVALVGVGAPSVLAFHSASAASPSAAVAIACTTPIKRGPSC